VDKLYKYFQVHELPKQNNRKTSDYEIMTHAGNPLGRIEFYNKWRQHVLVPKNFTFWSKGCLTDVNNFIEGLKKQNGKS